MLIAYEKIYILFLKLIILNNKEVISLDKHVAYKLTGFVILILGILFFLRDIGVNFIGDTQGWTIVIVLIGAGLIAGDATFGKSNTLGQKAKPKKD